MAGALACCALALSLGLAACGGGTAGEPEGSTSLPVKPGPFAKYRKPAERAVAAAKSHVHVDFPEKLGAPAPSLGAGAVAGSSHEVLGFLPSWELAQAGALDYSALSEVAYFALQVEPEGRILHKGPGWAALSAGSVATLLGDAHRAGVRVLLTLFTETPSTLREIARDPVASGEGMADRAAQLLSRYGFDGVDLDLEGKSAADSAGFVRFVAAFHRRLAAIDSSWSVVLDTLPQSAAEPAGFYDVKALAPHVDQLFVMAYGMSNLRSPGATAPLSGPGLSDATSLASYVAAVPPSKLILGIPLYGYDFQASRRLPPAKTRGDPTAVTYDEIVAAGHDPLWDPASETPFTSFRRGGHWHQTWFEDPASVALKVALAGVFRTAGVGVWELSMALGSKQMTYALDGGRPAVRLPLARQP